MQITPIRNFYTPKYIAFKSEEKILQEESKKNYSGKEITGAVLATALSATLLTGAILRGKNKAIKTLAGEVADLKDGLRALEKNNCVDLIQKLFIQKNPV